MHYPNVSPAVFLARPNRFVAEVLLDSVPTTVHVKNTGRCRGGGLADQERESEPQNGL